MASSALPPRTPIQRLRRRRAERRLLRRVAFMRSPMFWRCAAIAGFLAWQAGCTTLSGPNTPTAVPVDVAQPAPAALSEADRRFVIEAAGIGLYQVEAGRLADTRSTDPMVKAYAALLARKHAEVNEELRAIAQSHGLEWLGAPPVDRRAALDALAALAPEMFDRRFVEQAGVAEHQAELLLLESAGRTLEDPALRAWVGRTMPMLQDQLAAAQQLPLRTQTKFAAVARLLQAG